MLVARRYDLEVAHRRRMIIITQTCLIFTSCQWSANHASGTLPATCQNGKADTLTFNENKVVQCTFAYNLISTENRGDPVIPYISIVRVCEATERCVNVLNPLS